MNNNKLIWFDFDCFDLENFRSKIISFDFIVGATYFIHLFNVSGRRVGSGIPFTLLNSVDKDIIIEKLYNNIYTSVSYFNFQGVSLINYVNGIKYDKAFAICISKGE